MERITISEAAEMLGVPEQAVRCGVRKDERGVQALPIGFAAGHGTRKTYYIYKEKVESYMKGEIA